MKAYEAAMTTIGLGALGIFVAYIVWYLNDNGIWVDQFVTASAPIQEVMAIVIVIFLLVGVLIAAMKRR